MRLFSRAAGLRAFESRASWWLLLAVLVGATLRIFRLGEQLLLDDELHAIRVVARHSYRTILTTFFESDPCAPLTALYKLAIDRGVELTETFVRLPSLLAGLVILIVIPLAVRRHSSTAVAVVLAWLIAISPGLVLYSRISRPYALVVLTGFVAAAAFLSWWQSPRLSSAALFVLSAGLTVWLHIGMAPFIAGTFAFAGCRKLTVPKEGPRWRDVVVLALGLAVAVAAPLVPAWESFAELVRTKPTGVHPSLRAAALSAQWLAGTRSPWSACLFWLLALVGLAVVAHRERALALFSGLLVASQLAGMWLLAPYAIESPIVFSRYLLIALPVVLVWVATALAGLATVLERRWARGARLLSAVVLVTLFASGPLTDRDLLFSSFLSGGSFLAFHDPDFHVGEQRLVPSFYRRLRDSGEPGAVLEYTGSPTWTHINHLAVYQEVHRQPVLFAPDDDGDLFSPGIRLHRLIKPDGAAFLAAPARWLVVHKHTAGELDGLAAAGLRLPTPFGEPSRRRARLLARRMGRRLEAAWGRPHFEGRALRVWDLDAVRAAQRPAMGR